MILSQRLSDCDQITDNPELFREVSSYLLQCQYELQMYGDENDFEDFNFQVLDEEDLPSLHDMLNDLGPPEEIIQISIKMDGYFSSIYRIIYPTEVLLIPADIADKIFF